MSACQTSGCAVHARLRLDEVAGRLALDEVAGHGERPAAKPMTAWSALSSARTIRTASRTNGTASSGSGTRSRSTSARLAHGLGDTGPTPSTSSTSTPMPTTGSMMSANITARVDIVAPHRLQRHLRAELGLAADLEEVVALADLAVLGQRAARLAHEPDGRALDVLAPARAREKRLGHAS